jgi:hypothetical protein
MPPKQRLVQRNGDPYPDAMSIHQLRPPPTAKPRNPNRWLAYGVIIGAMFGFALDNIIIGLILGMMIGVGLRHREFAEAEGQEDADEPTLH